MTKTTHGGARYSTRPDAKPRGPAPDLVAAAKRITAAIRRHGFKIDDRDGLYAALGEAQAALDELDKPIIL